MDGRQAVAEAGEASTGPRQEDRATPERSIVKVTPFVSHRHSLPLCRDEEDTVILARRNAQIDAKGQLPEDAGRGPRRTGFSHERPRTSTSWTFRRCRSSAFDGPDPVPGARRRQPGLMGSNMQTAGGAAAAARTPLVGTGMERRSPWTAVRSSLGCSTACRRLGRRSHHQGDDDDEEGARAPADEIRALEPGHLHQSAPDRAQGRRVKRATRLRTAPPPKRRACSRPEPAVRVHELGGLQLRGRHHHHEASSRTTGSLDPHREARVEARDTKLGPEEITRDIPNVGEESLRDLDDEGVVRIGAEVGPATSWSARSRQRARPS